MRYGYEVVGQGDWRAGGHCGTFATKTAARQAQLLHERVDPQVKRVRLTDEDFKRAKAADLHIAQYGDAPEGVD